MLMQSIIVNELHKLVDVTYCGGRISIHQRVQPDNRKLLSVCGKQQDLLIKTKHAFFIQISMYVWIFFYFFFKSIHTSFIFNIENSNFLCWRDIAYMIKGLFSLKILKVV